MIDNWESKKRILSYHLENFRDNWFVIIKRRPMMVICIAMVPVILIVFLSVTLPTMRESSIPGVSEKEWYYDLNSGKLFKSKCGQRPPIKAPSGVLDDGTEAGVRAYVFYEGENKKDLVIGFLEKEQVVEGPVVETGASYGTDLVRTVKLIKRVEDTEWVLVNSPGGELIAMEYFASKKYTRSVP